MIRPVSLVFLPSVSICFMNPKRVSNLHVSVQGVGGDVNRGSKCPQCGRDL